jgi:TP901-1 family phage major tail protein
MVAQKGKDLLLKIDEGGGTFVTVAGLRSKRIAFNSETVDITDADSAGRWRELLAGSGVQRASLSGSGIFKDAQSDAAIRGKILRRRDLRLAACGAEFRHGGRAVPDHGAGIYRQP